MWSCDDIRDRIAFYVDDELDDAERVNFEEHLGACAACRAAAARERELAERVRRNRPLYRAPADLRDRVERTLARAPAPFVAPDGLRDRVGGILGGSVLRRRALASLAASLAIAASVAVGWLAATRGPTAVRPPSHFASMAIDVHERRVRGNLPLEVVSAAPDEISRWFAGKVPFGLKLPNYQEVSGQERLYELEGARLVGLDNDYAAYVAYRMGERPISLVVTSSEVAMPSGGEEISSKGLTFHFDAIDGLKVITWSDRGLTYALVSDLEERGQQSCVVCHQGTRDRDFIESLKPAV